jgi:SAM-dependent methyltransferase
MTARVSPGVTSGAKARLFQGTVSAQLKPRPLKFFNGVLINVPDKVQIAEDGHLGGMGGRPHPALFQESESSGTASVSLPAATLTGALREWWTDHRSRLGRLPALRVLLSEMWVFLRDSTPEGRRRRYGDVEYDWDFGVNTTSAAVGWRDRLLGVFHSPYQPTEPALFHAMMQSLPTDLAKFTFIDLGSGKGRTLLMASDYPFRRILGVELLPELDRIAQQNIRKYRSPAQNCFVIEARCGDAREFEFPAEPTVLFLFNPFTEAGLSKLIERLDLSLQAQPRTVYVLYHNPLLEHVLRLSQGLRKIRGTAQYSVFAAEAERAGRKLGSAAADDIKKA